MPLPKFKTLRINIQGNEIHNVVISTLCKTKIIESNNYQIQRTEKRKYSGGLEGSGPFLAKRAVLVSEQ